MLQTIEYRKAQEKDISILSSLDRRAFNRSFDNSFTEKEFKDLLDNKKASVFLVLMENSPIGFYITEEIDNEIVEIVGIALIPSHQNIKIGTQILKKLLNEFSDKKKIKIVTHPKNKIALLLYLKHEFIISEFNSEYYGENQPRVILYKTN